MRTGLKSLWIITILLTSLSSGLSLAADSRQLRAAFDEILDPVLDSTAACSVTNVVINHQDLRIECYSGRMTFFKPVEIDTTQRVFGAYFQGSGRFKFSPQLSMEKQQLYRFYHSDSLNRPFDKMFLLFTGEVYQTILDSCREVASSVSEQDRAEAKAMRAALVNATGEKYFFETLKNLVTPDERPFLVAGIDADQTSELLYMFNPYSREEVRLEKRTRETGIVSIDQICRYSQQNSDELYVDINGRDKSVIKVRHYDIDGAVDNKGYYRGSARVTFDVVRPPKQFLQFSLGSNMMVDSITDNSGRQVDFITYGAGDHAQNARVSELGIILDRTLSEGDSASFTFFTRGEMTKLESGEFFVTAERAWYPKYGYNDRASFDMTFRTPSAYEFVTAGNPVSRSVSSDTLTTVWKVTAPTSNVSFIMGNMKRSRFEEQKVVPVDIYFSEALHNAIGRALGEGAALTNRDSLLLVADDVVNCVRLFSYYFGAYPLHRVAVCEIPESHREAYPGSVNLGYEMWFNTDNDGYSRAIRAHEVAHQWWGAGVGWETYHDQWVSEAFAEYSSLLYIQAVDGNDKFLDRIRDYRDEIFSVSKYFLGSSEESGPIALGYRTASAKSDADSKLAIYKKGALVLHMLRNLLIDFKTMSEDSFFAMMREFYETYRGKNATTADFQKLTEKYTGADMSWFFDEWVYGTELPEYDFSYSLEQDDKNSWTANCRIAMSNVGEKFQMPVPLEIELDKEAKAYTRILVDKSVYDFTLPGLPQKPKMIRLNPFESVLARIKK